MFRKKNEIRLKIFDKINPFPLQFNSAEDIHQK